MLGIMSARKFNVVIVNFHLDSLLLSRHLRLIHPLSPRYLMSSGAWSDTGRAEV